MLGDTLRRAFLSRFAAGMELLVDRLEAVAVDVGVVLGRLNRGVAEEFLNGSQVGTAGEDVRREAVAQRVRARLAGQSRSLAVFLHESPQEDARQRPARSVATATGGGFLDRLLNRLMGFARAFLDPPQQFIPHAVNILEVVIRERGPLLLQLALGDVPVAFDF